MVLLHLAHPLTTPNNTPVPAKGSEVPSVAGVSRRVFLRVFGSVVYRVCMQDGPDSLGPVSPTIVTALSPKGPRPAFTQVLPFLHSYL